MIWKHDITPIIRNLEAAGVDVYKEDYVIVAGIGVQFDSDVYPLEIVIVRDAPLGVVYITKRPVAK